MHEDRLREIQAALAEEGIDAWLFWDFRGSDPIGRRILGLPEDLATRRWLYCIPGAVRASAGASCPPLSPATPRAAVSAVEPDALSALPGTITVYRTWRDLQATLRDVLKGYRRVAMQYSPNNDVPYVARVDAGTVELVRSCGVEVVSSADLVQRFEAVWSPSELASHHRAAAALREIVDLVFTAIARGHRDGRAYGEDEVQRFILEQFSARGLVTRHPPIVAVGPHSADPHYRVPESGGAILSNGDFILIDLWAKEPAGTYADITWTGCLDTVVPSRPASIFEIVRRARDAGVAAIRQAVQQRERVRGCDIDGVVRDVIASAGFGDRFVHRTGHSIGTEVHGNGANIDGYETPDTRRLIAGTCCSIEPGIYLPGELGIRSELNVVIGHDDIEVTGGPVQAAVVPILATTFREAC